MAWFEFRNKCYRYSATMFIIAGIIALFSFALMSCDRPDSPKLIVAVAKGAEVTPSARFRVESQGWFEAGHEKNLREILVITDTQTNKQYIGITGVGVTELVSSGKTKKEE
jgi:hypothetical protein